MAERWRARHAIVVGVSNYESTPFENLRNPVRDSHGLAERLRDEGFQVTELNGDKTTPTTAPTAANFLKARRELNKTLCENPGECIALLYFAGHGVQDPKSGQQFLVLSDYEQPPAHSVMEESDGVISLDKAEECLNSAYAAFSFVDACRVAVDDDAASKLLAAMRNGSTRGVTWSLFGLLSEVTAWFLTAWLPSGWLPATWTPKFVFVDELLRTARLVYKPERKKELNANLLRCLACQLYKPAWDKGTENAENSPFAHQLVEELCNPEHDSIRVAFDNIVMNVVKDTESRQMPVVEHLAPLDHFNFKLAKISVDEDSTQDAALALLDTLTNPANSAKERIDAVTKLWAGTYTTNDITNKEAFMDAMEEVGGLKMLFNVLKDTAAPVFLKSYIANCFQNLACDRQWQYMLAEATPSLFDVMSQVKDFQGLFGEQRSSQPSEPGEPNQTRPTYNAGGSDEVGLPDRPQTEAQYEYVALMRALWGCLGNILRAPARSAKVHAFRSGAVGQLCQSIKHYIDHIEEAGAAILEPEAFENWSVELLPLLRPRLGFLAQLCSGHVSQAKALQEALKADNNIMVNIARIKTVVGKLESELQLSDRMGAKQTTIAQSYLQGVKDEVSSLEHVLKQ